MYCLLLNTDSAAGQNWLWIFFLFWIDPFLSYCGGKKQQKKPLYLPFASIEWWWRLIFTWIWMPVHNSYMPLMQSAMEVWDSFHTLTVWLIFAFSYWMARFTLRRQKVLFKKQFLTFSLQINNHSLETRSCTKKKRARKFIFISLF